MATALGYLWMVYLGVEALEKGYYKQFHRPGRIDLSLFQLGRRLLEYLLKQSQRILVALPSHQNVYGSESSVTDITNYPAQRCKESAKGYTYQDGKKLAHNARMLSSGMRHSAPRITGPPRASFHSKLLPST